MKLAAVVALGAVLTACNGASDAAPEPSPSASVVAVSPSPSPEPSPSPTEALPANDVADPVEALEAIVRFHDQLFAEPDPDALQVIYAERCPCFEDVHEVLEQMAAQGEHGEFSRPRRFELVEVVRRDGPLAQIRYREDSPGLRILDADGVVIEEGPDEPEMYEVRVVLVSEGGRWRVLGYS